MDFNDVYYDATRRIGNYVEEEYLEVLFVAVKKLQDQVFDLKNEVKELQKRLIE